MSTSILIGTLAATVSAFLALLIGFLAATVGGWVDRVVSYFVDLFMGVPHMVFLMLISFILGGGMKGVIIGVALSHWPNLTRVIRGEVLQIREAQYVKSARKFGIGRIKVAWRHIVPHVLPQFIIGLILLFPHAILHEAGLTFLGFGLPVDAPAIGIILSEALKHIATGMWWLVFFAGVMLVVVMLFDKLGDQVKQAPNRSQQRTDAGERVALIGPSGCGKSTLAKVLAGYLTPSSGQVLFDGKLLPAEGYCPVQLIYQHPEKAINPRWKLKRTLNEAWTPDEAFLETMGIENEWLSRYPIELSGGELQRFCIARALGPQTRFIIADEISTMLDVITQAQIWELMLDTIRKRGLGLLVVTHSPELAEQICTRTVRFEEISNMHC